MCLCQDIQPRQVFLRLGTSSGISFWEEAARTEEGFRKISLTFRGGPCEPTMFTEVKNSITCYVILFRTQAGSRERGEIVLWEKITPSLGSCSVVLFIKVVPNKDIVAAFRDNVFENGI